ncbi:MAG: Ig-like domain-containing protein [Clostridia bacterium]|nr:Ig-like domain-containing protein [Clostridia bacterium]
MKKAISLLVAVVMLLTAAACAGEGGPAVTSDVAPDTKTGTAAPESTAGPTGTASDTAKDTEPVTETDETGAPATDTEENTSYDTEDTGPGTSGTEHVTDGSAVPVSSIEISAESGADKVRVGQKLALSAAVLPEDAAGNVRWSVSSGSKYASVSSSGVVTGKSKGTATVRAEAADGSGVYAEMKIRVVMEEEIILSAKSSAVSVGETVQISYSFDSGTPEDSVVWSVAEGAEFASVSESGLVTGLREGNVKVKAAAAGDPGVYGTISLEVVYVSVTRVSVSAGAKTVKAGKTLALTAKVGPDNASDKEVEWSVSSGSEYASVDGDGVVTGIKAGTATVRATASDGSGCYGVFSVSVTGGGSSAQPASRLYKIHSEVYYSSPYDDNDTARLVVCLQGLLNSEASETGTFWYLLQDSSDTYWLNYLRRDGKMLHNAEVTEIRTFSQFWELVKPEVEKYGIVLWDQQVPSTANVASTICSVERFIPVKYDASAGSLYSFLVSEGIGVRENLVGRFRTASKGQKIPGTSLDSTGSTKCDAYIWALDVYMDSCSDKMIAYVLDGASTIPSNTIYQKYGNPGPDMNQIFNHDYLIMNRCFFFDLSVVGDERPCDDKNQPLGTDLATAKKILKRIYERSGGEIVQCLGFPMWWMKYTVFHNLGKTGEVELEWKFAELITTYNCAMEADAAHPCYMTNGSLYTQYKLSKTSYTNNHAMQDPGKQFDPGTKYFTVYIGDYDSSAWLKNHIPEVWDDPARGTIPLVWGFNPNLADRIPMVFDYIYETMTDMDYIVTGDSGAGYANPSALIRSDIREGRASGADAWIRYNKVYNKLFDLDICGFLLNSGRQIEKAVRQMYNELFPTGSFSHNEKLTILGNTPYVPLSMDIYTLPLGNTSYEDMYNAFNNTGNNFCAYRSILWTAGDLTTKIPEYTNFLNAKNDGYHYEYVDPYTMFSLVLQSGQGRHVS